MFSLGNQSKYGLVKKGATVAPKSSVIGSKGKANSSIFDDNDEDPQEEALDIGKVMVQRSIEAQKNMDILAKKAMKEDPNIFDYDGAYDTMQAEKQAQTNQKKAASKQTIEAPKPRYISEIKSAVTIREKEKDRIYERKLLKEREEEDKEFGDQAPKFVTAAYKQKLVEDQKWEYENKLQEEVEKRHDVRSSLGMNGFYRNLLTKNVAMGGDVQQHALSVFTAGSERQVKQQAEEEDEYNIVGSSSRSSSSGKKGAEYDIEQDVLSKPATAAGAAASSSSHQDRDDNEDEESSPSAKRMKYDDNDDHDHQQRTSSETAPAPPVINIVKKEEILLSARERYLARKPQQQQQQPQAGSS